MVSFKFQEAEWYESLYFNKSYENDCSYYLNIFRKLNNEKITALDVGTGTGKLIPYLIGNVSKFIGIEPYNLFFNFTKKKFKQKNLILKNLSLEEYILEIDNDINLVIANFNVFNYLDFSHLKNQLKILSEKLSENSILVFDSWSLDYVKKQPFKSNNIKVINSFAKSNKNIILRFAESSFNKIDSKIDINFDFVSVSKNSLKKIGKEKHTIYPFRIEDLIFDLKKINWELIYVHKGSNVNSNDNVFKNNEKDYSEERNYFLSFILKKKKYR